MEKQVMRAIHAVYDGNTCLGMNVVLRFTNHSLASF